MPSIQNMRIEVSREQEEKTNGRDGWNEIPYTSELWSVKVSMHCPDLMSHILMVESQDPESRA